jgi:orotate phosphoribosyltransferase-like protein
MKLLISINNLAASGFTPGELAKELGMPKQRARFLFEKWTDKDLYEYGLIADLGRLTEKGKIQANIYELQLEQDKRAFLAQEVRA